MTQQTIDRLHDLRLKTMADAYLEQKNRGDFGGLSFDDRLQLLVEAEWLHRFDQRVKRRLKNAKLKQLACLEDINYKAHRGLDRKQMEDLATCHWIRAGRNVILTGPVSNLDSFWIWKPPLSRQTCWPAIDRSTTSPKQECVT